MTKIIFFLVTIIFSLSLNAQVNFAPYQQFYTGESPEVSTISDVNGDGLKDIIIATGKYFSPETDNAIFVFLQSQDGSLMEPIISFYNTGESHRVVIDSYDFNQDGFDDLVLGYDDNVKIMLSNGDGTFTNDYQINSGNDVDGVSIGDLDHDGIVDIAISHWNDDFIRILWGEGSMSFSTSTFFVEQGGWDQILVAKMGSSDINSILFMRGQGSNSGVIKFDFSTNRELASTHFYTHPENENPSGISVGDRNNDGYRELIVSFGYNNGIAYFDDLDNQNPTEITHLDSYNNGPIICGDIDSTIGDEILTVRESLSVLSNNTWQDFSAPTSTNLEPQSISIGDVNGDGLKDVIIADRNSGLIVLYNTAGVLSINSNENNIFITLFPNPTTDYFSISGIEDIENVKIFNVLGKYVKTFSGNIQKYDISELNSGNYFVKIFFEDGNLTTKKIIKK